MKPIIVLAVIAVAGMTLGTGFLGNDIELWIQQFGVGSGVIETPIDHVQVDFDITQRQDQFGFFKNLVENCVLTIETPIGAEIGTFIRGDDGPLVIKDSEITCKITDENREIIAEGTLTSIQAGFNGIFPAGTYSVEVLKDQNDGTSWPRVDEVHDVIVVVHANTYNVGDFDPTPP